MPAAPFGPGGRNRVAVRIDTRPAEHLVHEFDQALRHRVLEALGLGVDLAPAHAHDLNQKQLDQAVTAQNV